MGPVVKNKLHNDPEVTIVTGRARSGITTQLAEEIKARHPQAPPHSILWLVPSYRTAHTLRSQWVDAGCGATLGLWIGTFDDLATQILKANRVAYRPLRPPLRWEMLRVILKELLEQAPPSTFSSLTASRGIIDRLYHWTNRFQRGRVLPRELSQKFGTGQSPSMSPWMTDFLAIYERFWQKVTELKWLDSEERLRQAESLLDSGKILPFPQATTLVLDGFTDFVPGELSLIRQLSRRVGEIFVGLMIDTERKDLFAKPLRTLELLREDFPKLQEKRVAPPEERSVFEAPALSHLEKHLFTMPGSAPKPTSFTGITFLVGAHIQHEVELVAAEIKKLLLCSDSEDHEVKVWPSDIVVVVRSFSQYADRIWETFPRFGIPVFVESGLPLRRVGIIRALLAVVELRLHNWRLRDLLTILRHSYFRPRSSPGDKTQWLPAVLSAIRECGAASGEETFKDILKALPAQEDDTENSKRVRDPEFAQQLVKTLSEALSDWSEPAPWQTWVERFTKAAECFGLTSDTLANYSLPPISGESSQPADERSTPVPPSLVGAYDGSLDKRAWEAFWDACAQLKVLYQSLGCDAKQLPLEEAAEILRQIADGWEILPEADETGRVRVLSPATARAVVAPYVFLMGLSQGNFPTIGATSGLWSQQELSKLRELGIPLDTMASRLQDEMLLFYQVVTRAQRRLILSYPAADEKGEPLLPSSFVHEVELALGGPDCVPKHQPADLSPLPNSLTPMTLEQWRILAVDQARKGNPKLLHLWRSDERNRLAVDGVRRGLVLRCQRDRFGTFSRFDGMIGDSKLKHELKNFFSWSRPYSPTEFENYARCPFRFLMEHVLRIEPILEPTAATDRRRQGQRFHKALCQFHEKLRRFSGKDFIATDLSEGYEETLRKRLWEESFESPPEGVPPEERGKYEIDKRLWEHLFSCYEAQWNRYKNFCQEILQKEFTPFLFEKQFEAKIPKWPQGESDADQPRYLLAEQQGIQILGRIDRIDTVTVGDCTFLAVVDYKLGSQVPVSKKDWKENLNEGMGLQLALYLYGAPSVVAKERGCVPSQCVPSFAGYWLLESEKGFVDAYALVAEKTDKAGSSQESGQGGNNPDAWKQICEEILPKVCCEILSSMQSGNFPPSPASSDECRYCPFQTVCRVSECRALNKKFTWRNLPDAIQCNHPLDSRTPS